MGQPGTRGVRREASQRRTEQRYHCPRRSVKERYRKLYQSFGTRGVLLDMVRYKGCESDGHLPSDYPITVEDLEGCCQAQNVEVRNVHLEDYLVREPVTAKIHDNGEDKGDGEPLRAAKIVPDPHDRAVIAPTKSVVRNIAVVPPTSSVQDEASTRIPSHRLCSNGKSGPE